MAIKQVSKSINENSSSFEKNILALLGITAAASAINAKIKKNIRGSEKTTLIISHKEMNDIIKYIQYLEDSNIFLKRVTKTVKNETKDQKGGFLGMFVGTLRASLLIKMFTGKGMLRAGYGHKKGKRMLRASYWSDMDF